MTSHSKGISSMSKKRSGPLVILGLLSLIGFLNWKGWRPREASDPGHANRREARSNSVLPRQSSLGVRSQGKPRPPVRPLTLSDLTPGSTNSYTFVHSNIIVSTVSIESPMEKWIGTDQYELLAKSDYESNVESEPYLRKIHDLIESERPGSERLYSAIRMVYEMRADVLEKRRDLFDLEYSSNATLARIRADPVFPAGDKQSRLEVEINDMNAEKIRIGTESRRNYDRFLKQMGALLGELSEATMERFAAFEPRFSPRPLRPPSP
jgi:hypothetical protein